MRHEPSRRDVVVYSLGLLALGGCRLFQRDRTKVVRSKSGTRELTVPLDWMELDTNLAAEIMCGNRVAETYAMVLTEPKEEFKGYTLQRYCDLTRGELLKKLSGGVVAGHVDLQIDDRPAIQYELQGSYDEVPLAYVFTNIELAAHYAQVTAWTTQSRWNAAKTLLTTVVMSFRERTA